MNQAFQEQQTLIDNLENELSQQDSINTALQDQITTLYNMITSCCSNNGGQAMMQNGNNSNSSTQISNVELSDAQTIVLDQNVPNPFSEMTTITFSLTEKVNKAQMLFYNIEGKLINSVDLSNQSGKGQLNVFANDLSTGIYTYTLVVDGKIVDTKRMVKQ